APRGGSRWRRRVCSAARTGSASSTPFRRPERVRGICSDPSLTLRVTCQMDEMRERIVAAAKRHRNRCAEFLRELIAIPSPSRQEEAIAVHVRREMQRLQYDEAEIDRFGNVVGRIGDG